MLTLQNVVEVGGFVISIVYIIGQIKTLAESNQRAIETLKTDLTDLIEKNSEITKDMMEMFKISQGERLKAEIGHVKDMIAFNASETKESIRRLEDAQRESNRIKERLALAEASIRSLHKRLDITPDIPLRGNEE